MTQEEALTILKTGGNIFLTGEPGSGKTYVLNSYVEWLEDCGVPVAITASTGIAATHIGGMTIHAWSGIGARDDLSPYDIDQIANKEKYVKRIKNAKVLVIDEISMLAGGMLDMIDKILRTVKQSEDAFGGLQVVLVGDFYQLPPITRMGDVVRFAFESNAWERGRFLTCYLTEQHRQEDEMLLSLLSSIRRNEVEEDHYTLLSEQTEIGFEGIEPTKLFTHNKDVDAINHEKLQSLSTTRATFKMETRGGRPLIEGLQKNCLSPQVLELREEAMVMCTKNNFEMGYVNGTLGRVVRFDGDDGYPIIETSDGREIKVEPESWRVEEEGKVLAEITQVPLRLAWAITIHKSQGMSLDAVEIDLRNAFTYGQGYVALSRVRTLKGMKLLGINQNALMVDPKIVRVDERFRQESEDAETAFKDMDEAELATMHEQFVRASGGTIPKEGAERKKRTAGERIKKESTLELTKEFLRKGLKTGAIAKQRQMALSTIWGHVEKLAETREIARGELMLLVPDDVDWESAYSELKIVMEEVGTEKLKPIFEGVGEKYDYDLVRLARILYTLDN